MDLDAAAQVVAQWAASNPLVKAAYLFGSRVKGSHNAGSDLDVAISLEGDQEGLGNWIFKAEGMREVLGALLQMHLDLQMMHSEDLVVMPAVREHGFEIFNRAISTRMD